MTSGNCWNPRTAASPTGCTGAGGPWDTAVAARTLGRHPDLEVRRVGWDDKQPTFRPVRHAWRVEVAHGRLGRFRRLAKSFENTTTSATGWLQVACIATTLRHLYRERALRRPVALNA
jgi:putative transposase